MGKPKKNKKGPVASATAASASESSEDEEKITTQKKSVFQMFALDDEGDEDERVEDDGGEDEETETVKVSKKSKKQKNKKAAKNKATVEDEDDEFFFEEKEKPKGKKEKKGKNRKRNNEDEDEIDRMLAELELEYAGGSTKKLTTENNVETTKEEDEKKKRKKKQKGKKDDLEEEENFEVDEDLQVDEKKKTKEEDEKKKRKKKQKGKKDDLEEEEDFEVGEDLQADEKKKTKEDEKKKRKKKQKGKKDDLEEDDIEVDDKTELVATTDDQVMIMEDEKELVQETDATSETKTNVEEIEKGEKDDEEEVVESEEKKKPDKKEKEDRKRPGKKQLLVMQEALRKLKEEEERAAREEEKRIKEEEKAQRLMEEQLRLEKEEKELRKLKAKEKHNRLKAEGKLLTKAQKAQRARAMAMIEAFRAQGVNIPRIGEKRDYPARPMIKTKVHKGKTVTNKDENEHAKNGVELAKDSLDGVQKADNSKLTDKIDSEVRSPVAEVKPVKLEEPKDAWDLSSDSEKEEPEDKKDDIKTKQVQISIKEEPASKENKQLPQIKTKPSSETETSSEEEEGESEDESDDDDESESDDNQKSAAEKLRERALVRIQKRREQNEKKRSEDNLRSPIVCVLGHVDTGKTKILDKIRHTHVQDSEAGGITQQIGATMVPVDAIKEQAKMVKNFSSIILRYPGLLIIDTPGHESFSNLRSRGSSLCDIAILVVDIMHGLEPQTIESINLLKKKKTPFIVALNKVDRLYDWKVTRNKDIRDSIKSQSRNTIFEFEERTNQVILQFSEQGLNSALFYENNDVRTFVSLVPTSATTGEGMGNLLALVVELTQKMLAKRLAFSEELQATVLELKAIPGLGTTIDVILVNGRLKEGDTIVLAGMDGPVVTQIRSLLMPQPLKELRVKNPYQEYKEIKAAQGVKLTAKDLEKVIAGLNLTVAHHTDEIEILKEVVSREFHAAMSSIKLAERGVYVQASTLGSLEALLEFLRTSKVPYSGIRIGPVVKRDVMKASIMLEHDSQFAVILAFDVKIERDAHEMADSMGVKIFSADIIYHLFDRFTEYREQLKAKKREELKHIAVFPCKLRILPNCIFNSRDPIVVGVSVEAGVVKEGTTLCVPSQEFLDVGIVTTIEINHKQINTAKKGQEVCIKIEPIPGETPKLYGRHFDHTDMLVSKVSRQSIDACKEYFRDDLQKSDWQLMVELKKLFQII